MDLIDPVTEQVYGQAPISDRATSTPPTPPHRPPSRSGATPPRPSASSRCSGSRTRWPPAPRFADLESQDTGKPRANLVADEIDQSVDQLRFFAGAARSLEGEPPRSTWRGTPPMCDASRSA
jgi:betaine-aldehyde dehydrogenase